MLQLELLGLSIMVKETKSDIVWRHLSPSQKSQFGGRIASPDDKKRAAEHFLEELLVKSADNDEILEKSRKVTGCAVRSVSFTALLAEMVPELYQFLNENAKQESECLTEYEQCLSCAKRCVAAHGTPARVQEDTARQFFSTEYAEGGGDDCWVEWGVTLCTSWSNNLSDFDSVLGLFNKKKKNIRTDVHDEIPIDDRMVAYNAGYDDGYEGYEDAFRQSYALGLRRGQEQTRRTRALREQSINVMNNLSDRGSISENIGQPYVLPDRRSRGG